MQNEVRKAIREVTIKLTDEDLVALARKASTKRKEVAALELERDRVKKAYNGKIEGLTNEITKLLDAVETEQETVTIEVEETFDFIVVHGAKQWRIEPGEAATFKVVTEEIFGKDTLVYEKAVALTPSAEPAPQ